MLGVRIFSSKGNCVRTLICLLIDSCVTSAISGTGSNPHIDISSFVATIVVTIFSIAFLLSLKLNFLINFSTPLVKLSRGNSGFFASFVLGLPTSVSLAGFRMSYVCRYFYILGLVL